MNPSSVHAKPMPVLPAVEAFLDRQLDKFPAGRGYPRGFEAARLMQTYDLDPPEHLPGEDPLRHRADVYDSALAAIYYVQRGRLDRARQLLDGMRLVQKLDPYRDGRVRASYYANSLMNPQFTGPSISSPITFTGNVAWAGIALTRFYDASERANYLEPAQRREYLEAAVRTAEWILAHTRQEQTAEDPFGGFSLGQDAHRRPLHGSTQVRATEHNTDIYTLALNLAAIDPDTKRHTNWRRMADEAQHFVRSMFDPKQGRYWIGTRPDRDTGRVIINSEPIPADCQTWPVLARIDEPERARRALGWLTDPASKILVSDVIADPKRGQMVLTGTRFTDLGRHIQIEMTAGAAMALWMLDCKPDATVMVNSIEAVRLSAPTADPRGIGHVATAWPAGADTGMGDTYPTERHVASTVWTGLLHLVTTTDPAANPFLPLPSHTALEEGSGTLPDTF